VAIILFVICFSFCGYYIVCHLVFFLAKKKIIAKERRKNDRQYNRQREKQMTDKYKSQREKQMTD
jgi:predicted membrane protein